MSEADRELGELPEGWQWRRVGEVCSFVGQGIDPTLSADSLYLGLEHIESWTGRIIRSGRSSDVKSSKSKFSQNDVLYGKLRPYLAKVVVAPSDGVCTTELLVLRCNAEIRPQFMAHALRLRDNVNQVNDATRGTQLPRANGTILGAVAIPVPPIDEQRRILTALESILEEVDRQRTRLERLRGVAGRTRRSVLAAAFRGDLAETTDINKEAPSLSAVPASRTVRRGVPDHVEMSDTVQAWPTPDSWAKASVADLLRSGAIADLKDGNHGSNHPKTSELGDVGLPFIMAREVRYFSIDYDGARKVSGNVLARIRVGFAKTGDVILTHKGTIGQVAVCDRDCVLTPQTTYIRCDPTRLLPRFVMYALASPWIADQLSFISEQTTRDFAPISEQYKLFLPVCPLEEQQEIVRIVDRWFAVLDDIDRRITRGLALCDRLRESLLQKAFRGELLAPLGTTSPP